MAVVPVGAVLANRELDLEGVAGIDAGKHDPGDAVHLERQQDAVPMDRRGLVEMVVHAQAGGLALPKFYQWPGDGVVDGNRRGPPACNVDDLAADMHVHVHIAGGAARYLSRCGIQLGAHTGAGVSG